MLKAKAKSLGKMANDAVLRQSSSEDSTEESDDETSDEEEDGDEDEYEDHNVNMSNERDQSSSDAMQLTTRIAGWHQSQPPRQ